MSRLLRASSVIGSPVVSVEDGEDVAEVRDVVYDGERHRLIGFTLNKRGRLSGRLKQMLPSDGIRAVGPDAVMIDDVHGLAERDEVREELSSAEPSRDVIGAKVLTESGRDLGTVTDVILRTGASTEAVGYQIAHRDRSDKEAFVPIHAQMAVSGDALVVPDDLAAQVRDDLAGLGNLVDPGGR